MLSFAFTCLRAELHTYIYSGPFGVQLACRDLYLLISKLVNPKRGQEIVIRVIFCRFHMLNVTLWGAVWAVWMNLEGPSDLCRSSSWGSSIHVQQQQIAIVQNSSSSSSSNNTRAHDWTEGEAVVVVDWSYWWVLRIAHVANILDSLRKQIIRNASNCIPPHTWHDTNQIPDSNIIQQSRR